MTNAPDLIAFVRARLDERQEGLDWDCWETRDIAAKRAIVDAYKRFAEKADLEADRYRGDLSEEGAFLGLEHAVQHLAAIDADHPDYNPEWRLT